MTTAARSPMLRAVRGPVALSAEVRGRRDTVVTEIMNMSGTGALLSADKALQVGDVVFMRFSVPGSADVETEARVARVDADSAGVAFQNLDQDDAEMIVRHVMRGRRPTA
jgi:hypothetical protein